MENAIGSLDCACNHTRSRKRDVTLSPKSLTLSPVMTAFSHASPQRQTTQIAIQAAGVQLCGELGNALRITDLLGGSGIVLFAHGSGSSRHSPRNQFVAGVLEEHGFATLLLDLLTDDEQYVISKRFDIALLTTRLIEAVHWIGDQERLQHLPIGLFGASTGAAAALRTAALARRSASTSIKAVVCRGGRTDLTGSLVTQVRVATLLIVGSEDREVLALNQQALAELQCEKRLVVIPGATHLFEEQGALDDVAHIATYWFKSHLGSQPGLEPRAGLY